MDDLAALMAKDQIRDLAMLYARGVDRQDVALLRTLYTTDGWDKHGSYFDGPADKFCDFLAASLPHMHVGAHNICQHLIALDPADHTRAEGEVYCIAWHMVPGKDGGLAHDVQAVRYIDQYRHEGGRWKFARRELSFDMKLLLPDEFAGAKPDPLADASYGALSLPLFGRRD